MMEENGIDDILGQMKNNFNKSVSSETEPMDPEIDDNLNNKKSTAEEVECDKADSDGILETHSEDGKLNSASTKRLKKLSSDDEMLENESPLHNFPSKMYKQSNTNPTSKRTRRRPNSKSIIQNAIARKEKSFGIYEKPKSRKHAIRTRSLTGNTKTKSSERQTSPVKKQTLQKRTRLSSRDSVKNLASDLDESDDITLRRSQRASSSGTARITFKSSKDDSSNCTSREANATPPVIPIEQLKLLKAKAHIRIEECHEYGLIEAIENGSPGKVSAIIESGNINMKVRLGDYNNGTFLHLAILKGNIEIVYLLVSNQVDIDILDSDQNSALMLAALEHKNGILSYLVKAGADITLKGIDGMTSLHVAAKSGNLEACKIILNSGFSIPNFVNLQDDGGWTPLVWACEHGYVDVSKYLVSKGADVNIRDVEHNVALHWAAFKGSSEIVELLLNLKTDINVLNVHGDTPLHISAREDHYNCVIIFLSRKADISIINKNNETPLDCAPKDGLSFTPLTLNQQLRLATSTNSSRSLLMNDISKGREQNPIQCYNGVDSEGDPASFTYIKKNCLTSDNVQVDLKVSTVHPCTCNDRCKSSECGCAKLSIKCWYDDHGKLLGDFNFHDPPLIFECNDLCSCNAILCVNRLVQKPSTQRFQLFKTASKGWGIKSLNYISAGNYVCEYVGEMLTDTEAEQRIDDSYLFDLDNRETDSFCIDAKFYGNFARFINHSCDPNLHPLKIFIEHHDLRFPRIAFFAKRDIESDEELSFDYGEKFWLVKYKSFTCDCKADVCKYSKESIRLILEKLSNDGQVKV